MSTFLSITSLPSLRSLYSKKVLVPAAADKLRFKPSPKLIDRVYLHQGDIAKLQVDAIVNAANKSLLGGGGVDGVIHAAAGRGLLEECRTLKGCETGQAKITKGYKLPAKHVIHAVGPIYHSSVATEVAAELASCYRVSLDLTISNQLSSVAFCAISTGIYGYPIVDATHIALNEVRTYLEHLTEDKAIQVIFVVWSDKDKEVYENLIPLYFPPEDESGATAEPTDSEANKEEQKTE